jgi:hypothetical protein
MTWIGDLSLDPEDQILVNLDQVRFITCEEIDAGRMKVTLNVGDGQTVELKMPRASYTEFLKMLDVRDVG